MYVMYAMDRGLGNGNGSESSATDDGQGRMWMMMVMMMMYVVRGERKDRRNRENNNFESTWAERLTAADTSYTRHNLFTRMTDGDG